jgi:hypothetical protein
VGRPVEPFAWTSSGNYPAGANPWNGQPIVIPVGVSYFTPQQKPPAQWWNYILSQQQGFAQQLGDWTGQDPACNWWASLAASSLSSQTEYGSARFCPKAQQWLLATGNHGIPNVSTWLGNGSGADGAADWTQLGATISTAVGGHITSVMEDPTTAGNYWFVVLDSGAAQHIYYYSGGSWASVRNNVSASFGPSEIASGPSNGVVVVATAQASAAIISHTTNSGGSWTDFATGQEVDAFLLKWNGSIFVAVSMNVSMSNATFWTSPDGLTWTAQTFPSSVTGSTHNIPFGLAWDASASLWRLGLNAAGGGIMIASSPDGVTWSVTSTVATAPVMSDLSAAGALLVATGADKSNGGPYSIYYAFDGGTNWWKVQAPMGNNVTQSSLYYTRPRVHASNQAFVTFNSLFLRESFIGGTPASHL